MEKSKFICVYFKSNADADKLKDALKALGIHATSSEVVSTSFAENMNSFLRAAHEHVLKAYEICRVHD